MSKKSIFIFSVIIISLFLFSGVVWGEEAPASVKMPYKVFRLSHRPAASVVDIIGIYLSKEGKAVVDERTNSLIVKDYGENLAKIEEMIKSLDVPMPQVQVYIKFLNFSRSDNSAVYGGARYDGRGWRVALNPDFSSVSTNSASSMNLAIISGSSGFIKMGERVPYAQWFYEYSLGRRYITRNVVFQDVATGFFVTPNVRPAGIEISVAPGIYYFDGKNRNRIIFREMETSLFVKEGQTVVIGAGDTQNSANVGLISRIIGGGSYNKSESFSMMLTVKRIKDSP